MRKNKLFHSLLIAVVLWLAAEAGLRIYAAFANISLSHDYLTADKLYGWALKPNYNNGFMKVNSLGFRGEEFSVKKPDNVYRILMLGDSITFGTRSDKSYPDFLRDILDSHINKGKRYEVINGGVPGYGSEHVLKKLNEWALRLKPDLIIIYTGWNDLFSYYPGDPRSLVSPYSAFNRLLNHSYVMKFLVKISFQYIRPALDALKEKSPAVYKIYYDYEPVATRNNFRNIVKFIGSNDLKAVIITMPSLLGADDLDKYKDRLAYPFFTTDLKLLNLLWGKYNRVILDEARTSKNVFLCDARSKIAGIPCGGRYFRDTSHFTAGGSKMFAELIYAYLTENGILEN